MIHMRAAPMRAAPTAPPQKNPDAESLRAFMATCLRVGILDRIRPHTHKPSAGDRGEVDAGGASVTAPWPAVYPARPGQKTPAAPKSPNPPTLPSAPSAPSLSALSAQQAIVDKHAPDAAEAEQTIERARQEILTASTAAGIAAAAEREREERAMLSEGEEMDVEEMSIEEKSGPSDSALIAARLAGISDDELRSVKELLRRPASDSGMVIQKFSVDMKVCVCHHGLIHTLLH
jgi:hypothetical protein